MESSGIWPRGVERDGHGSIEVHGRSVSSLLDEFGSPLYVVDMDDLRGRAESFVCAAASAFPTATTHVSYAGKALLSKEIVRAVLDAGMFVDTCTMGEMRLALAAGAPGRRLVLHGNNKSDDEIALAVTEGFSKIVVDEPSEPARIAAIAHRLGRRARVMLRVTCGIHAGGHEFISTAHEDQKFGVPLLPPGVDGSVLGLLSHLGSASPAASNIRIAEARADDAGARIESPSRVRVVRHDVRYPFDLNAVDVSDADRALADAMQAVSDGPALSVLQDIARHGDDLELVGIHSHIGSQIHDASAFIEAARRMMLLRKTFYATDAITLPEVDLGGGFSVAYTSDEDSMDVEVELRHLAEEIRAANTAWGMPQPIISFEPGRWIVAPAGITLYRVGVVKPVPVPVGTLDRNGTPLERRVYVSVDGGMSDNIRPALYGADYTAALANRTGAEPTMTCRVVGMHCESGDIVVRECQLPEDIRRGDILAVPVTGAYGRTMASNYNQAPIPAVVSSGASGAHVMIRRQTVDDLLSWDMG
ncbi:diaminopimelate decarboxylase [uncultured Bifidobacterium sp.]|uniref:diaminopimelate decarboxylase family protein n=1 Tax=uncultured Bifidobacterium sp. TaxID=165187 RepID=UPI0026031655|nr:diaminopimelate decarboxylase [uncultured Bifidobacterium sp.]